MPSVPTQPETFSGTYTSTVDQFDGYLVDGADLGQTFLTKSTALFASETAGVTAVFPPVTVQIPVGATNLTASVFSVYNTTDNEVALILDNTVAAGVLTSGLGFSTVFSVTGYNDETTLAMALETGDTSYLTSFLSTYASTGDFPAVVGTSASGTIVDFSNATLAGTAALNFVPAPEPSTWAMMFGGAATLLVALRKRAAL